MKKVSDSVREIVSRTESAQDAMRSGYLNFRAYAALIKPQVEEMTWKEVKLGSIVVALSRLQAEIVASSPIKPAIALLDLHIKSPLCDLTYERNQHNTRAIQLLYSVINFQVDYLAVTYGLSEITLICSQSLVEVVKKHFVVLPMTEIHDLVGITVSLEAKALAEPNTIYTILSSLAVQRINIREIISTNTTLTLVIDDASVDIALAQLRPYFKANISGNLLNF